MAYEIPGYSFTLPAGEDWANKQFRFGVLDNTGAVDVATDGAWVVGVVQNTPSVARAATVMNTGVSMVEAGEAIAIGDAIASDSLGRAKTSATGDVIVGRALEAAAAAGEFVAVLLGGTPTATA